MDDCDTVDKNLPIIYSPFKDAVNGSLLICEMYAFYKKQGISLLDKLNELYNKYGFCLTTLHSYEFDGLEGFEKMMSIMKKFRDGVEAIAGRKVIECMDYIHGRDGLPKSDVLKFCLEGHFSVVIRPSGTEPKLKVYITVSADRKEEAEKEDDRIKKFLEEGFLLVGECN